MNFCAAKKNEAVHVFLKADSMWTQCFSCKIIWGKKEPNKEGLYLIMNTFLGKISTIFRVWWFV